MDGVRAAPFGRGYIRVDGIAAGVPDQRSQDQRCRLLDINISGVA